MGAAAIPADASTRANFFVRRTATIGGQENGPIRAKTTGHLRRSVRACAAVRALLKDTQRPRASVWSCAADLFPRFRRWTSAPKIREGAPAPVIYAAQRARDVVLSGGRRLDGGRWGEVNGRRAWVIDVPDVKEGRWRFRQLFVNGTRRPRTRLPKQGEYRIESLPGYTGDFLISPTRQFIYAPGNIVPSVAQICEMSKSWGSHAGRKTGCRLPASTGAVADL